MTCRVPHQGFPDKDLLEHVVMGKRLVASRRLVGRTRGSLAFALYQRNRRERIGNALDRFCFAGIDGEGVGIDRRVERRESLGDRVIKGAYRRRPHRESNRWKLRIFDLHEDLSLLGRERDWGLINANSL